MEAVTLTLNGQIISAPAGQTILQAAQAHGARIPTLCHHDCLRPIGACRICQVEELGRGVVLPACATQVASGMNLATDSERVRKNRRNILRLLMAAHPESCLLCEKGNTCQLRRLCAEYGVGETGLDPMPYHPGVMDLNPFLARDLSKCIMCAKCIRADQEVVCEGVLEYNRRGFDAHPATLFNKPLALAECTFCGTCLSLCPVGAIAEKNKTRLDHAGAATESVCSFCGCGCQVLYEHNHDRVSAVRPADNPASANGISLCVKGHFGHDYLNHPDRLRTPLLRENGELRPAGWEEALAAAAKGLSKAAGRAGGKALGFMAGGGLTVEEAYLLGRLARDAFNSPHLDSLATSQAAPGLLALHRAAGLAAATCTLADLERAEAIVLAGGDPTQTGPVLGYHLKRAVAKGANLVLLDGLAGKLATMARVHLQCRPGGEAEALAGLCAAAMARGGQASSSSSGKVAGLYAGAIKEAAEILAGASRLVIVLGDQLLEQADAETAVEMALALAANNPNQGSAGRGVLPLLRESGSQAALDMGLAPWLLAGQAGVGDRAARSRLKGLWGKNPAAGPGLDAAAMLEQAGNGIKGMVLWGADPVRLLPGARGAFARLEFLLAAGLFLSPELAQAADVVLPLAALPEKEGTLCSLERRLQKARQAVPPPGGLPPDWQVLCRLAQARGRSWDYPDLGAVWAEIERAAPMYAGAGLALQETGQFFWPHPGVKPVRPRGAALEDWQATPQAKGFPFLLLLRPLLGHLGAGVRSGHSARLAGAAPQTYLGMAPAEMEKRGWPAGQMARILSPAGSLELPVYGDARLPKGVLLAPLGFPGANPMELFAPGEPAGMVPVSLRKV